MPTTYPEKDKPGIQVIQKFTTTSPSIVKATLSPVAVGPCYQVLEAYKLDANGNSVVDTDSQVSLPAILNAPTKGPYNLDGKTLKLSYKGEPTWSVLFTGTSLTASQAKDQINSATPAPSGWAPYILTKGSDTYLQLRSVGTGGAESIKVLDGDANTPLGYNDNFTAYGKGSYIQDAIYMAQASLPDPRDIVATGQADVDETSIRAFLNDSTKLTEVKRTEAFLRRGQSVSILGSAAITFPTSGLDTKALEATLTKGGSEQTLTFGSEFFAMSGNLVVAPSAANSTFPGTWDAKVFKFKVAGVDKTVTLVTPGDLDAVVTQINAVSKCCYRSDAAGAYSAAGTYLSFMPGQDTGAGMLTNSNSFEAVYTGSTAWTLLGFTGTSNVGASLLTAIVAGLGSGTAKENASISKGLELVGATGYLKVGDGDANTLLKLTNDTERYCAGAVDDGDGDTTTPVVRCYGRDFTTPPTSASLTGGTILGVPDLHKKTLITSEDGGYNQEIEFDGGVVTPHVAYSGAGLLVTDTLRLTVNGVVKNLTWTAAPAIAVAIAAINAAAGQTVCYRSDSAGGASQTGTFISWQVGGAISAGGSLVIEATGTTENSFVALGLGLAAEHTLWSGTKQVLSTPFVVKNPWAAVGTKKLNLMVNGVLKTTTFATPGNLVAAVAEVNAACGAIVCYPSTVAGAYSAAGTYMAFQMGGATPTAGVVYAVKQGSTGWTECGFDSGDFYYQLLTALQAFINATMGAGFASGSVTQGSDKVKYLKFLSTKLGVDSKIEVWGGTANAVLGLTDNTSASGGDFVPKPGDLMYAEGVYVGKVLSVAVGGVGTDLRLDTEVTWSTWKKQHFYMVSQNIPTSPPADRPYPNLFINTAGDVQIKHDLLRDTKGAPLANAQNSLLLTYKALRLDVTAKATNPGLLTFSSTTEIATALKPITTDNPLGLGANFMALNAAGIYTHALGVDAVSTSEPGGTVVAHQRAVDLLESYEVYGMAPLTYSKDVHAIYDTHVDKMADPEECGERIVFICPQKPTRNLDTLAGSGTDGDYISLNLFDTKDTQLSQALVAKSLDPDNLTAADGVFLDIATDAKKYSISKVSGTRVYIRVTFSPGENDDSFYAISNLPSTLISEAFSVYVRGARLVTTEGLPDRLKQAKAYADMAKVYASRRVYMIGAEQCAANIGGVETLLAGYNLGAAYAGMSGQLPPQQGMTNYPITGFTRVIGSNDYFSEKHLKIGAGGGVFWVVQNDPGGTGGAIYSRHQLSTDVSTIERQELSITRVTDYTAKFLRTGLRNFIGRYNITTDFLDTLGIVLKGQLSFLVEAGILIGAEVNRLLQDADNPDTALADVTLEMPYPFNTLRLTLVI